MLYTIGKPSIYEPSLDKDPDASKGISGSVWETFDQARAYRDARARFWNLYCVDANWEQDAEDIGEDFRALTKAGKLIRLDQKTGVPIEED